MRIEGIIGYFISRLLLRGVNRERHEGKSPPDEITLKVAEMYQTDPAALVKSSKDEP